MVLKVIATGFLMNGPNSYLKNSWNVLDFVIVVVSIVNITFKLRGETLTGGSALRALRTVRVLRPLRMVSRQKELKLVVDALLSSIPSIVNVGVVCILFFLIFAVMGVNYFKGVLNSCQGDGFDGLEGWQQDLVTHPKP